jgi:O-antigen/teichoic acid export membrane protein
MLRGTFYLTISRIVFVVTNLILHPYLGRKLGPELYGIFGVISTFIVVNELILFNAIYVTVSKFVAEKEEAAKAIIRRTLKVLVMGSIVIGGICFFFAEQIASLMNAPELVSYIRLFAFIIPIVGVSTVFLGALNGLRQFGRQALISIVFNVVRLICVFILVFLGFSVKGAVIGLIIADLFRLAIAKWLCRPINIDTDFDSRRMFSFTLQLMVITLITSLVMNIDLLAVKVIMKDNLQTGLYTSAVTIAKIPLFLMFPLSLTVLPAVSKSISDGDMGLTEQYIRQSLRLLLILVFPISFIIMATSGNLIHLFYGSKYILASAPLNILILGAIFLSIEMVMYNVIVASGWPRYIIFIGLLSLLIDIALLTILVDKIGLVGAATASTITHFFGLVLSYGYVAKKFMTRLIPFSLMRTGLASLVLYLIATVFSPSGILLLFYYALLLCLFFFLLVIMKEIDLEEIKQKLGETLQMVKIKAVSTE